MVVGPTWAWSGRAVVRRVVEACAQAFTQTLTLLALAALLLAVAAPTLLSAQGTGRVAGVVRGSESKVPLPGAQVTLVGSTLTVTTNNEGRFVLAPVVAGELRVRISYLGRTPRTITVSVTTGGTTTLTADLESVVLSAVTVRASGQAEALSRQQNAANIKNVVAADQMGRFPDASAPEAVQRLPGVALQRDQGEGRYVQLRGSSAATTQVTVNGEQIGSPEASSRQIALDAVPVGVLAAVEVSKAITPDMDADAVGGSVNLITKRPGIGRTVTAELSGGYAAIREQGSGLGAVTYGDRSADGRFGWLLSGSYGRRNFGSDGVEPDYDDDALNELEVRHYSLWRQRTGSTASLDFRPNARTTFYVNGLWSELQDQEQRRVQAHLIEDGELAYLHKNRLEKISTLNVLAGAEHQLPRGIQLDYRAGATRSQEDTPFDREFGFLQEDVAFSPSRADVNRPQPNPSAAALAGTYAFDEMEYGSSLTRNRDLVGAFNLSFPLRLGTSTTGRLRVGAKARDRHKDQVLDAFATELEDGDLVLGRDIGSRFDNAAFSAGRYAMPFRTSASDVSDFTTRFRSMLSSPEADLEAQSEAFDLRERVLAGYVSAELNLTPRLLFLPGVRVEQTQLESDGNVFDAEEETLSPMSAKNNYTNLFPMAHLRYRIADQTNVRAAYTQTIFRPNFFDLVPYRIVDGEDVETGNPQLKPMLARNYDLMIERYDQRVGVISAGVFFKQLTNPVFSQTLDNELGGETTTPVNAQDGEIRGVELAWQQRFTSLPGVLSGLGLYSNFTYTDSRATQPNGRVTRLAGQSSRAYNIAVSYEKYGFSGQVSLNHVGDFIDELGEEEGDDLFANSRSQLDLSMSYFFTSSTQVYAEAINLTNAPYRTFQGAPDRMRQREFYRPSLQLGLRFRP